MAICYTSDQVTDAYGHLPLIAQQLIQASARLTRQGCKFITDRLIRAESGVEHTSFFKYKKMLIQLGIMMPGWKILLPENWQEQARRRKKEIATAIMERYRAWRERQRQWAIAKKRKAQLQLCTPREPTRKPVYINNEKTIVENTLFAKYGEELANTMIGLPDATQKGTETE